MLRVYQRHSKQMTDDGARLRRWRRVKRLTQAQTAALIGVDANTWARWEHAERTVTEPVLRLVGVLDRLWQQERSLHDPVELRRLAETVGAFQRRGRTAGK